VRRAVRESAEDGVQRGGPRGAGGILCCFPGLLFLKMGSSYSIWLLNDTYGAAAFNRMEDRFPFALGRSITSVYFYAKGDGDLFAEETLLEVGRAMDRVLSVQASTGERLEDCCEKDWRGWCEAESVFHQFNSSAGALGATIAPPQGMGEVEGLAHQFSQFCSQSTASCAAFLGPQEGATAVTVAEQGLPGLPRVLSLVLYVFLDTDLGAASDASGAKTWQGAVLEEIHGPSYSAGEDSLQTANFFVSSWSKAHEEFEASRPSGQETHLMAIALVLVNVFTCCAIAAPRQPRARVLLASCCMLLVVLALVSAVGLCGYAGVPFTIMTSLSIFTLFGVSVDAGHCHCPFLR
ncbi:unnamed protein product, partial [Prorocentrum cordatum]